MYWAHCPEWSNSKGPFETREQAWKWIGKMIRKNPNYFEDWSVS